MVIGFLPKLVRRSALMNPLSVPDFSPIRARIRVLWRSVRNEDEELMKKLKRNFVGLYLGHDWSDFLQIC